MEVTEAVWVFVMVVLVAKVEIWLLKDIEIRYFVKICFWNFDRVQSILVKVVNVNCKLGKLIVSLSWWIWGNVRYFYVHLLLWSVCLVVVFSQLSKRFPYMPSGICPLLFSFFWRLRANETLRALGSFL